VYDLIFLFVAGSITCAAYPLEQIDTIDIETGNISKNSALNLVVFGVRDITSVKVFSGLCPLFKFL
jgi:hypothetical protein